MGVGASILVLSGIFRAACGSRLLACTVEKELVGICERGELRLRCGVVARGVGDLGATHDSPPSASCVRQLPADVNVRCLLGCSSASRFAHDGRVAEIRAALRT
jgi:hypothetical protein